MPGRRYLMLLGQICCEKDKFCHPSGEERKLGSLIPRT